MRPRVWKCSNAKGSARTRGPAVLGQYVHEGSTHTVQGQYVHEGSTCTRAAHILFKMAPLGVFSKRKFLAQEHSRDVFRRVCDFRCATDRANGQQYWHIL